jgi:hypothetical protein
MLIGRDCDYRRGDMTSRYPRDDSQLLFLVFYESHLPQLMILKKGVFLAQMLV